MPAPPPGEADLQALAARFGELERRIRVSVAKAPTGNRRSLAGDVLRFVADLRHELAQGAAREAVLAAYLDALRRAGGGARAGTVRDLARSLHLRLDRALVSVREAAPEAIRTVTDDNLEQALEGALVAHEDARGTRWALGAWAAMNCATTGRAASSRGVIDAKPRQVVIEVSGCSYCQEFEGIYAIEEVPGWPPFHPSCSCVAAAI